MKTVGLEAERKDYKGELMSEGVPFCVPVPGLMMAALALSEGANESCLPSASFHVVL